MLVYVRLVPKRRGIQLNGAAVRELRMAKGLSQVDVAELVGISGGHLCNIETDKRGASPKLAKAIATALHVPLAAIEARIERVVA
jgi:transcriptional regulator with XRE-family HTH domain